MKGDKKKILSIEYGSKSKMIVYIIIRALVIGVMIAQILNKNWDNVFICGLTLILLLLPSLLSYQLKIVLPNTLEIIIVCFIFAAEILGEVQEYYVIFEGWDDMLHTMNGFLAAAVGFAMIDVLNEHERVSMTLSPAFVAVVAFCFSGIHCNRCVLLFHDDRRAVGILRMQHGYVLRNRYAEGYMDICLSFCCPQSGRGQCPC